MNRHKKYFKNPATTAIDLTLTGTRVVLAVLLVKLLSLTVGTAVLGWRTVAVAVTFAGTPSTGRAALAPHPPHRPRPVLCKTQSHCTAEAGSGDSSVVRASDSWLKGPGFESLQERREFLIFLIF